MPIEEDDIDFSLVTPGKLPACDIEIGFFSKHSAWNRGYATGASRWLLGSILDETPLQEVVATLMTKMPHQEMF